MTFKLPSKFDEIRKEIHELKYITIGNEKVHVSELDDRSVTPEYLNIMRMNSYAQDDLPPKLTNEALIEKAKYHVLNSTPLRSFPCTTYDEALIHKIVPELIKRLEEKEWKIKVI